MWRYRAVDKKMERDVRACSTVPHASMCTPTHCESEQFRQRISSSAGDKAEFIKFLDEVCADRSFSMSFANVATILHRAEKLRYILPRPVVSALTECLLVSVTKDRKDTSAQTIGYAFYGLQHLGDSDETRRLMRALEPKVQMCTQEFTPEAIGNILYGIRCVADSEELRKLVRALVPKLQPLLKPFLAGTDIDTWDVDWPNSLTCPRSPNSSETLFHIFLSWIDQRWREAAESSRED